MSNKIQKKMEKYLQKKVDSEVGRFFSNDLLYIILLVVSSALYFLGKGNEKTFLGTMFFGFYEYTLIATVLAYIYLKFFRRETWENRKKTTTIVGTWLLLAGIAGLAVLVAGFYLDDAFSKMGMASSLTLAFSFSIVTFFLILGHLMRKTMVNEKMNLIILLTLFADGLAWIVLLGGIGTIVVMDAFYIVLILAEAAGFLY